jgi:hypothetical protein
MTREDFTWVYRKGRDTEGEAFSTWVMLHGSGRIYAKVQGPNNTDEYTYRVWFYCQMPQKFNESIGFCFMELEAAQEFCMENVLQANPTRTQTKQKGSLRSRVRK